MCYMKYSVTTGLIDYLLKQRILLHILFWIGVLLYFTVGYGHVGEYKLELFRSAAFLPNHIWLAYTFFYFLIPWFLLKNRMLTFFGLSIVFIVINMYFSYLINFKFLGSECIQKSTSWNLGSSFLGSLTILGIAISIKMLRFWYKQKQENLEIQREKLSMELVTLKAQVHPHFLFNTLNNLYSLALEQSRSVPSVIIKLSDLLRYMLYDCNTDLVPLDNELEIMTNYIELEQIRYGDRLEISKNYSGDISGKFIPPLLILPLIENCFKHGTSKQLDQCWITISVNAEKDSLQLKLINSKISEAFKRTEPGGIGLQNIEKRLKLLYGDAYTLTILSEEETFTVSLSIPLIEKREVSLSKTDEKAKKYEYKMLAGG